MVSITDAYLTKDSRAEEFTKQLDSLSKQFGMEFDLVINEELPRAWIYLVDKNTKMRMGMIEMDQDRNYYLLK